MKNFFKQIVTSIIWWQSRLILKKYRPKIVAITGSVGKTSTKDAIYTVLSSAHYARKSHQSFNSQLGVPLTILGRPNGWDRAWPWFKNILWGFKLVLIPTRYPEWLVLEIGVDRPGGLKKLTSWLHPDVVVITRFGKVPAHVEFFESREEVIAEKSNLVTALKEGGLLVLNADDEDAMSYKLISKEATVTYGVLCTADLVGGNYTILYSEPKVLNESKKPKSINFPESFAFKVDHEGSSVPVIIKGVLGHHHMYPILAGLLVGISKGLPLLSITDVFEKHLVPPARMHLVAGVKDTMIIDDSYNASPVAMAEALKTFGEIKTKGRKISVLGDMLELGRFAAEEHKKLGREAAELSDILITVGIRAKFIAEGALIGGMSEKVIYQYEDSRIAGKFLEMILKPGDLVLVKGSQGVRMERVVEEVMADPRKKKKLLVRQDEEWANR